MFGFSMGEMLLIMAIALIAIGPKQLPEVARTIGRLLGELKRATGDFTKTFTDVRDDTQKTWTDARKGMNDVFTAGAASYAESVRAAPVGAVSKNAPQSAPGEPVSTGHDPHAHPYYDADGNLLPQTGSVELDPQGSLFVPTDLSNVTPETSHPTDPSEEQLSFSLTSFDDDHGDKPGSNKS
jgi:sec-independent protein translocase protein TatB